MSRAADVRRLVLAADQRRAPRPVSWLCSLALLLVGVGCALSALVGVGGGARPGVGFGSVALVAGGAGALLLRTSRPPIRIPPHDAILAVVAAWMTSVVASTVVYVATGGIDDVDRALFESASGYATSALSGVRDPSTLPASVLFWRAWTQWTAGFGSLLVAVLVLPTLGLGILRRRSVGTGRGATAGGTSDGSGGSRRMASGGALEPGSRRASEIRRRLALTYLALTGAGVVAYLLGGLGPFDAVTYAFTTVSTGGFTNGAPLEAFDGARLQWAAIGGMVVAGAGIALVWRGARGVRDEVTSSRELRTYAAVVLIGTAVLTLAEHDGQSLVDRVRVALFTTTSLVSTTGFAVDDWALWGDLAQVVVLALLAVGSMSGSPGGGFRILRARVLAAYAASVVLVEEHRRAAVPVTLGDTPVPRDVSQRMVGYQVLWIATAFVGAILLAATGLDAAGAVSGSISALATVGPGLGDLSPGKDAASLAGADLAVLGSLSLMGRVGLYPVLAAAPALLLRRRRRRVRRRRDRRSRSAGAVVGERW